MSVTSSSKLVKTLTRKMPKNWGRSQFMVYDVETYKGYFCVAYSINDVDGNEIERGVVDTARDVWDIFKPVFSGNMRLVGFNNSEFDDRIMLYVLSHIQRTGELPHPETIHNLGNLIISGHGGDADSRKMREEELARYGVPSFGAFFLCGMSDDTRLIMGTMTPSLKVLEGRMGSLTIEETPIPFDKDDLTGEEIVQIGSYCLWDTRETRKVYLKNRDQADSFGHMGESLCGELSQILGCPVESLEGVLDGYIHPEKERVDAGSYLGLYNLRSLPQSQFAERYVRIQNTLAHHKRTGEFNPFVVLPPSDEEVLKHPRVEQFSPDPHIPLAKDYQVRRWVREGLGTLKYALHERGSRGGKPQMHLGATKADTADAINLNGVLYRVGVGGIHSVDPAGIVTPELGQELVDLDVTSFYPQLVLNLSVAPYRWPKHLQEEFLIRYRHLMEERIALKGKIKKSEGEEKRQAEALAYAYKIVLNSVYGKFRDRYSVLWSPKNQTRVTLHGQLFLLHMVERVGELGGKVISANTDGFTLLGDPSIKPILMEEAVKIGYTLEETVFEKIVRESISCYAAIKPNGEIKRKGAMETKLGLTAEVKRPVVYDAVVDFLLKGIPVETTINGAVEAREWTRFCMMRKTTSKSPYFLVSDTDKSFEESGKVFRFVWASPSWTDRDGRGRYRLTKKNVENSNYGDEWDIMPCRSLKVVDPKGIDIGRYVSKAWEIISKILPPTNQEEFLPTTLNEDGVSPKMLWDAGVYPAANRGKIVLTGKNFSTIQPWGNATTLGCYTGKKYGRILVIDVDDPDQFRKFLGWRKGQRAPHPEFELPETLPGTLVSVKDGVDPFEVLSLNARGKLVFRVPEDDAFATCELLAAMSPTAFNTKARAKVDGGSGFDIFYGDTGGHPSLTGRREDGANYRLVGDRMGHDGSPVKDLPLWLWQKIEAHFLPADRQKLEIYDPILGEDDELLAGEAEEVVEVYHQFQSPSGGVEFSEDYSEKVLPSMRGATWVTMLLEKAIKKAGDKLFPNEGAKTKSHFAIPNFSPHVVEIDCFGNHSNNRGRKTVVAVVEDPTTGEARIVYKCLAQSCSSHNHEWRSAIQHEFDQMMSARRQRVVERLQEEDEDYGTPGDQNPPDDDPEPPTAPRKPKGASVPEEVVAKYVTDSNPVARWTNGAHLVGAYHQPTGSGKGYGMAQHTVENMCRGMLTTYVAPRNAQVYTFLAELKKAFIRYRHTITGRIGEISDLTGAKFTSLHHLSDGEFAQTLADKLVAVVNADNHAQSITLNTQLIVLTNAYYFGQKGDSGKAHPFSFQLEHHAVRLGRQGTLLFDEYHDTVSEAWTKSLPVTVRYKLHHSESYAGLIPMVIDHCPGKPSGWARKSSGNCAGCLSCSAPSSLTSKSGVLSWKELKMVGNMEEHPFGEAENAPLMELGEVGEWVPITQGKTQVHTNVVTMRIGNNLNWDDRWHEGEVSRGWGMNAPMWVESKDFPSSDTERKRYIYKRDKAALSYNLRANFGIRAVMDVPLNAATSEPILTQEALESVLEEHGQSGIVYPRGACQAPRIQWVDATALYRLMSFLEGGWKVRFFSATMSEEAFDHIKILADGVADQFTLEVGEEFSLRNEESESNLQLEEVLVIGTGVAVGTFMSALVKRQNTQLLAGATDADGKMVPNRIAAFFGRQREAQEFWDRFSGRHDYHPWWGLHQSNLLQLQHVIGETDLDLSHRKWMTGNTHESVHLMSYLYGSLSTGANISNLRTLICDYSTPPPMRSALTPYREVDADSLKVAHRQAFVNVLTQVCGRALRFRDSSNRAVILICGIDSHEEFIDLVEAIPFGDRASQVRPRYIANPNDLMPLMYKFLHRKHEIAEGIMEDLRVVEEVSPLGDIDPEPVFIEPLAPMVETAVEGIAGEKTLALVEAGSRRGKLAIIGQAMIDAVADKESWASFKYRYKIAKFGPEVVEGLHKTWEELIKARAPT